MRRRLMSLWLAALVPPLLFTVGCSTTVKTKMLAPARAHEAAQLSRVAVLPFSGATGKQTSIDVEALMVSVQVEGKPFFSVIERAEIEKVAKEHKFQMSGLVDEASAASLGKILGAEAIVLGTVSQNTTEDKHYKEKRSKCTSKDKKGNCKRWSEHSVGCTERTAIFQFTPKVVNVENGSIAASEAISGKASDSACSDSSSPIKGKNELLSLARQEALERYRTFIAPHYVDFEIGLLTSDDSKMDGEVEDKIDQGVNWAKAGRLDRACECWDQASRLHKTGYAIPYLLGVCCEVRGDFEKAQYYYVAADKETSKPVEEISTSLMRTRDSIEKQRRLQEQTDK